MRAVILAAVLGVATGPAFAVDDYDDCIALIATDPAAAERQAGDWARFGGGPAARHCYALALIEIGAPMRAADELIGIAQEEASLDDRARSDILVQAGELLLDGGSTVTATVVSREAIRLTPASPGALGLRAAVNLQAGNLPQALGDLNAALASNPKSVRLLLLRASAYRRLGNGVAGRDDAIFATELDADNASAWAERGRNEALLRDKPAARNSFLRAIDLDREGKIGTSARFALQRMEAGLAD